MVTEYVICVKIHINLNCKSTLTEIYFEMATYNDIIDKMSNITYSILKLTSVKFSNR